MARSRHLRSPPIKEAALSIAVSCDEPDRAALQALAQPYVDIGWETYELTRVDVTLGGESTDEPSVFDGIAVSDAGESRFLQFRRGQLTLNDRTGYEGWESLLARTEEAFVLYAAAVKATSITRIATRFINRIPSSATNLSYGEMLERPPLPLPGEGLEGARISDFLRRHAVEGLDGDFRASLTIGTVRPEASEVTTHTKAVAIDIEVYKSCNAPPNLNALAADFKRLREIKNALFFGSLTEEIVGGFE